MRSLRSQRLILLSFFCSDPQRSLRSQRSIFRVFSVLSALGGLVRPLGHQPRIASRNHAVSPSSVPSGHLSKATLCPTSASAVLENTRIRRLLTSAYLCDICGLLASWLRDRAQRDRKLLLRSRASRHSHISTEHTQCTEIGLRYLSICASISHLCAPCVLCVNLLTPPLARAPRPEPFSPRLQVADSIHLAAAASTLFPESRENVTPVTVQRSPGVLH
jgi:hypothetical protein